MPVMPSCNHTRRPRRRPNAATAASLSANAGVLHSAISGIRANAQLAQNVNVISVIDRNFLGSLDESNEQLRHEHDLEDLMKSVKKLFAAAAVVAACALAVPAPASAATVEKTTVSVSTTWGTLPGTGCSGTPGYGWQYSGSHWWKLSAGKWLLWNPQTCGVQLPSCSPLAPKPPTIYLGSWWSFSGWPWNCCPPVGGGTGGGGTGGGGTGGGGGTPIS
jgi:hypothetical protein